MTTIDPCDAQLHLKIEEKWNLGGMMTRRKQAFAVNAAESAPLVAQVVMTKIFSTDKKS
jgi:hypothetical protein